MKIVELTKNKLLIPLTNEETALLEKFNNGGRLAKSQLEEREQIIANQLTVKDILQRTNEEGKIYYQKLD